MNFDAIIIGSGFGGLICGALLSKNGYKVAVVEQHNKVGGFASHFKRHGYTFEVAVHLLDSPSKNNFRTNIFNYLNLENAVEYLKIPYFFGLHSASGLLEVPADIDGAREILCKKFPSDSSGINLFFSSMERISDQFADFLQREPPIGLRDPHFGIFYPDLFELSHVTIVEFVHNLVKNSELRWALMANLGFYFHDLNFPASAYLVNQANYFNGGVRYVRGGVQNLSNAIATQIEKAGGKIFLKNRVDEIIVLDGTARGIKMYSSSTSNTNGEGDTLMGKYIIANAAVPHVYKNLLKSPQNLPDSNIYPPGATESVSATTMYLGLKKPFHTLTPASFFNFYRYPTGFSCIGTKSQGRDFSLVDYSVVDRSLEAHSRYTADLVFLDSSDFWKESERQGTYAKSKEKLTREIYSWLQTLNSEFSRNIEVMELGTPRTIENFTQNTNGAIYGFNGATMDLGLYLERLRLKHKPTDRNIKNLYFASAWSACQSISGVTVAGYQAARSILESEGITLTI